MATNPYLSQKAKIISIKPQTDIDYTFILESGIKPSSGQFVEVSLPKVGECPISVSDFGDGWFEMTIRRVGKVTNVLHQLKEGDGLFIRGPYGNGFSMDKYRGREVVVAAGGTGLAPVKSLLNRHREFGGLTLLAGFKSPADVLFRPELKKWGQYFNATVTVDRGDENWNGNVGLITQYVQSLNLSKPGEVEVIVVGPPLMMKFTVQEFLRLGVPEKNITVSFERKMCCGIGKCGHCKIDDTYVCLEGPVFNYTRAKNLID
ncbi:anaerobic sulfite reductase subunit B [Desulfotomaculum arcticum]|uniref:Anaerobic sulfite reductase subunit B n=1 Tax=Desulfotruncus arcticus DSM 17038 TaxID=1121424 RepID=A0A1I2XAJ3_9FIRM|nr:anaerobic sulfite reductase subunit AsrB [Desulfotruncus arcticus]SFH09021.1 anaerobic sulfite reductase subunit B [Desulfotomaculum arcticum] [Desulfotruncus arcticus DSM 17038]